MILLGRSLHKQTVEMEEQKKSQTDTNEENNSGQKEIEGTEEECVWRNRIERNSGHRGTECIQRSSGYRGTECTKKQKLQTNSGHRETLQDIGTRSTRVRTQRSNGNKGTWTHRIREDKGEQTEKKGTEEQCAQRTRSFK